MTEKNKGELELGIDEAGRGPVIGPMVIAGAVLDNEGIVKLKDLGVKDSKLLSIKRREFLIDTIKKIAIDYKILILPPSDIDDALNSPTSNLNKFELINMAIIANSLKSERIVIDSPSNNIESFKNTIRIYMKDKNREIIAEHKADDKYVSVAAASILAKVTRDREIEKLKLKHKIDFGSGYPADPKTIAFLAENYNKYDFFRKTWSSWKKVSAKNNSNQSKLNKW
ncbi:MAG: ribonuclease HII [Nanoarchaeota archaeon]